MTQKLLLPMLVLAALYAPTAHAAQDAMVITEQAAIRERPTLESKIIETKPTGAKVRVSSFSKDGWYKVKSSIGQYGWIWQADLTLMEHQTDVRASNLDLPERAHERRGAKHIPWFFLRAGLGFSPLFSQIEAENRASLPIVFNGHVELQLRLWGLWGDLRIAGRLQTISPTVRLQEASDHAVIPNITAGMFGLEQDLSIGESSDWSVALYAGVNLNSGISVLYSDNTEFVIPEQGYSFMALVNHKIYLKNWLALLLEGGLFWSYTPQSEIPGFASSHVNVIGPFFSGGLQLGL